MIEKYFSDGCALGLSVYPKHRKLYYNLNEYKAMLYISLSLNKNIT